MGYWLGRYRGRPNLARTLFSKRVIAQAVWTFHSTLSVFRIRKSWALGLTWEQWQETLASRNHARRLSTLAETANAAVFMASDGASGMTGTILNLTMGNLDD